jgi:hypothetical protein
MRNEINAFHLMNSEIADLSISDKEKLTLDKLIEQDKCFAEIDFIDGISVWEKGLEQICKNDSGENSYVRFKFKDEFVPEQFGGVSFFHSVGGRNWHVRIHKGE